MNDIPIFITDDSPMVSKEILKEIQELYRVGKLAEAKQLFIDTIKSRRNRFEMEVPNEPPEL